MVQKPTLDLEQQWEILQHKLQKFMGLKALPDLNATLFLIGVQELGQGIKPFSKEEKQDLMHIAICKVLSYPGFYELEGQDEQGWPHWKLKEKLPFLDLLSQEAFLKKYVIEYFENEVGI